MRAEGFDDSPRALVDVLVGEPQELVVERAMRVRRTVVRGVAAGLLYTPESQRG
jgi:hypothetical protein